MLEVSFCIQAFLTTLPGPSRACGFEENLFLIKIAFGQSTITRSAINGRILGDVHRWGELWIDDRHSRATLGYYQGTNARDAVHGTSVVVHGRP